MLNGELVFDDWGAKENMLGKPEMFLVFSQLSSKKFVCNTFGRMKKQLDVTVAYAKSRQQFNRPKEIFNLYLIKLQI